jgi:hypothetical protein
VAEPSDVSELTDAELYRRYRQFTAELEGLMGYDPDRRRQLWDEIDPLTEELKRRFPPATKPLA